MQKPEGYDEVKASGDFIPVELGGHFAIVKQVAERQSSTGKDMVVVLFDFDSRDAQPNYFADQFNNDDRPEKKWPYAGSKYVMVNDYMDPKKTSKNFKTFCSCIEKSNNCQISWGGSNWAAQFKGKKIGVVFGEEESEYDGKVSMRRVPKWFCSYDSADSQKIPAPKLLKKAAPAGGIIAAADDSFLDVSGDNGEIPF